MECATCGAANPEGQTFCSSCGASLEASGPPEATAAPAAAPTAQASAPTPAPTPSAAPPPPPASSAVPPQPGSAAGANPTLATIGDIVVTQREVITPTGTRPLGEVTWAFQDLSTTSQAIPTWAIVCTVIFALACLLGLLFLLVKEERTSGTVQVTVQGPNFVHISQIPVSSRQMVQDLNARVNYARSIGANYQA